MKTNDFAFVGIKIIGIILFIKGIQILIAAIGLWVGYPSMDQIYTPHFPLPIYVSLFSAIVLFVLGLLIWRFTGKLLKFILPEDNKNLEDGVDNGKIDLHDLQTTAFSVVGLVILSISIPQIFITAADILAMKVNLFPISTHGEINPFAIKMITRILGHLIYLLVGIYLLFGLKFKKILSLIGKGISKLRRDTGTGGENSEGTEE